MVARRNRVVSVLAIVACTVLWAVACGSGVGSNSAGQDVAIPASNPWGGDPESEPEPVPGGSLTIGTDREAEGFDPTGFGANAALTAVYDSLMRITADGVEPYLAESMETTADGTTWTLRLRPDVRFHDDTPLNADAVLFNVQRHRDDEGAPGNVFASEIESMRAVDELTVEITLTEPNGQFPTVFALPRSQGGLGYIASPAALRQYGDDIARNPVGAGPFRFVEWIPDSRIVLERNEDYWQEGLPYLDRLLFRPLPDTESRYASVESGDADLIFAGYHTELIRGLDNPNLSVFYGAGDGAELVFFNFNRPPFDDRRMREAMVRAIDLNALAATQFRGRMERAPTLFNSNSPNFSQRAADAYPSFDRQRARQLIEDYTAEHGTPDITYATTNAPNRILFAEFLQAQLAEVGLDIRVNFYDLAQYSAEVVLSGNFNIGGNVAGPWNDPFPSLYNLLHTDGNTNYGRYSNQEMDRVIEQAITTTDPAERTELYQQAQMIASEDIPGFWYTRGYLSTIARSNVHGVQRYPTRDLFYATLWAER